MHTFTEERLVPYTVEQLYDLVLDVERYPDFLPWCAAMRVQSRTEREIIAEALVSFKAYSESYTSRIMLQPPSRNGSAAIMVEAISGPFEYLHNNWQFKRVNDGTIVQFHIDFRFKSVLLDRLIGIFFAKACEKMMAAFLARAEEIYGQRTDAKQ